MKKQDPKLYWKFSELSFDRAEQLFDAYTKLRAFGYRPIIRQTDETLLRKFIMTIASRKMPLSDMARESYRLFRKNGVGLGKSYYYVKGTTIEYKLPNTDWDVNEKVRFENYEDALRERNRSIVFLRWEKEMVKNLKPSQNEKK